MKKHLFIAIAAAVMLLWSGRASAAAPDNDIRVLLSTASYQSMDVTVLGDYVIQENPEFDLNSDNITLWVEGNRLVIRTEQDSFSAPKITLISKDDSATSAYVGYYNANYGFCTYLGDMQFSLDEGHIRAINTLPAEHYLYGVVPYEMSNRFPVESLKAQAVCARSYAAAKCVENRDLAYDIVDTADHQVYYGFSGKYTRAINAVNETQGKVLTSGGVIIPAFFTASNGGQTELTDNVWNEALPYYIQQDDFYDLTNPDSPEQKAFIPAVINTETIPLMDPFILSLIQSKADSAAGGPVDLLSVVSIIPKDPVYHTPSRSYSNVDVVLMASDNSKKTGQITVTIAFEELVHSEENPAGIFNVARPYLRMRGAEKGSKRDLNGQETAGWFLTNRRYGHGIGLSQRGAQQRAVSGQMYQDIVNFYYSNVDLITFKPADQDTLLNSDEYTVTEEGIFGVEPGTESNQFVGAFSSDTGLISLVSYDGSAKEAGQMMTGDMVRSAYENGTVVVDLPVIILGDVNGDGDIAKRDMDLLQWHLLGTRPLRGAYLAAADVNQDGAVDNMDLLAFIWNLTGKPIFF